MSLILNYSSLSANTIPGDGPLDEQRELDALNRYMAMIEDNKNSCRFVPNDALLAIDMASFVRERLDGKSGPHISASRLAMALVQPCGDVPVQ